MPPTDTSDAAARRYLTRLLCALTLEAGGELRIPLRRIRELELESSRQLLAEDTDVKHDQLVLRFGTKHSAVYPVESECQQPQPATRTVQPSVNSNPSASLQVPPPQIRPPQSVEELTRLEKNVRARRVQAELRRASERAQRDSLATLDPNSTS